MLRGHHRAGEKQRRNKGPIAFGRAGKAVIDIHQGIAAGLNLGEHACRQIERIGAGAAAGHLRRRQPGGGKIRHHRRQPRRRFGMGGAAGIAVGDVLKVAAIGLDAAKGHAGSVRNHPCQRQRVGGCNPGAVLAQVDIDEQFQAMVGRSGHLRGRIDHGGDATRQHRQPCPAPRRHRRRHQQVGNAGGGIAFGLPHRLAAQADRAARHLQRAQR